MGSGTHKHHTINFHLPHLPHLPHILHHHHHDHHHHHQHHHDVPKGCMVVMVGHEGEEKLQRFVIPIVYTNHPLFLQLLKEAEDEYGFNQVGPITLPCHVDEFRHVQHIIDQDQRCHHHGGGGGGGDGGGGSHFLCFKA